MDRLIEGYRKFKETYWQEYRDLFESLATVGQSPSAMVIACCDSRVDPQTIFSAEPGEMFVVRNVANLVPPYAPNTDYHGTSAALEFAVKTLEVKHIIVLGHSGCGGVRKLMQGPATGETDFIDTWMKIAAPAREKALALGETASGALYQAELENIRISIRNLHSFPWIEERVNTGKLALHGWYFEIETGELKQL